MNTRTQNRFNYDLEKARKKLAESGRFAKIADAAHDGGGLLCDFELPYSSLPKILSRRWK